MKFSNGITIPLVICLFAPLLTACQGSEATTPAVQDADLSIMRITADDLANLTNGSRLSVSTTQETDVLVFDPSRGPLNFGQIQLTCPNGQRMGMDVWLLDLAEQPGADLQQLTADAFSLALTKENAVDGLQPPIVGAGPKVEPQYDINCPPPNCWHNNCVNSCYLCPDGQYICTSQCYEVCEPCAVD